MLLAMNVLFQLLQLIAAALLVVLIHWPCADGKEEGEVLSYAISDQWGIWALRHSGIVQLLSISETTIFTI